MCTIIAFTYTAKHLYRFLSESCTGMRNNYGLTIIRWQITSHTDDNVMF